MSLLGKINAARTVAQGMTPAGIAWAVLRAVWPYLLLAAVLLGLAWWLWSMGYAASARDHAAEKGELVAALERANSQRDSAFKANVTLADSEQALRNALDAATNENMRLDGERNNALAQAEIERRKAETTFGQWQARNAGTLAAPNCKAALAAMARACPVMEF